MAIQYKDNDEIEAIYNEGANISITEKPGYVKVVFDKGENGEKSVSYTHLTLPTIYSV